MGSGTGMNNHDVTGSGESNMSDSVVNGPITVTDANFVDEIENSSVLAMVDFWAEWCGPCRIVGPIVEELAADYAEQIKVGKMDVDSNPQTPQRFNIRSIPSILFFKDGELVDSVIGALPRSELEKKILEHA
jgi:thioredoxin 1